ncbi:MAG: hypothetical protein U0667_10625 [Chloroflexota bacterium]
MLSIPCPWCEAEVGLTQPARAHETLRCEECATLVDLAPLAAEAPVELALAA